ncbi:MAG: hypothetical protein LBI72_08295 [Flavobacteriaceae bacterium]|jgi:hypothetical protein|nr:hypothetical protein [Flavobacteriaceae bacterium]
MRLKELFNLTDKDRKLSVTAIQQMFNSYVVLHNYYNKWFLFKDDEVIIDFLEAYNVDDKEGLDSKLFSVYFQEDDFNTRLVISRAYTNDEGKEDAEMYHYFIRRTGLDLTQPLLFYQGHNVFTDELVLLTPKDEEHLIQANKWFTFVCDILLSVNHLYEFNDKVSNMVEHAQQIDVELMNQEPPVEMIFHNGIFYRVVSIREGLNLLKGLRGVEEPNKDLYSSELLHIHHIEENAYFLVVDYDVEVEELEIINSIEDYDIDIQGYLFLGDLIVTNHLFCQDLDYSPILMIKGNLTVKNAYFCGNIHFIGGSVYGETIYAKYNHGALYINGALSVDCIIAQDMNCYIGSVQTNCIISDFCVYGLDLLNTAEGTTVKELNLYPTTHRVSEALINSIKEENNWEQTYPNDDDIVKAFRDGKSIVRKSRNQSYAVFTNSVAERFNTIFNEIIDSKGMASYVIDDDLTGDYFFNIFMFEGKKYREIGRNDEIGKYQARVLHEIDTDTYSAILEFYQDDSYDFKCAFCTELTDAFTSTYAVLYAFIEAEKRFYKEKRI